MKNIATIVLAAGTSSRLGQPKQLIKFQGETLIAKTIGAVQGAGLDKIVVVLGAYSESIKPEVEKLKIDMVYNASYKDGIGSSISIGTTYATDKWKTLDGLLILLCDQPFLDSKFLELLHSIFLKDKSKIVSADYNKTFGPPVIFPKNLLKELKLLKGDNGAKTVVYKFKSKHVSVNNEKLSIDIDNPNDLKKM